MNNRNLVGKLGGVVYYMNKGQNVVRDSAASVSNPRTTAQQEQRLRLGNLVAFYRGNQPWMKRGAFESKKATWSDYNAFVSANSKVSPVYLTKGQIERGACVVAPYIVTKGTLPSVQVTYDQGSEVFLSDLYVGSDIVISGTTTAAELSAALRANNNGLQAGDQISVIQCLQGTDNEAPTMLVRAYEFIIDEGDNRTLADLGLEGVILGDNDGLNEVLATPFEGAGGVAFIVSRTTSGAIKVSTQSVVLTSAQTSFLANFTSQAAFDRASASYGSSEENFLSSGYMGVRANGAVPVEQSLLSIEVGDLSFTSAQEIGSRNQFGDVTPAPIKVNLARPVAEVSAASFTYTDRSGQQQTVALTNPSISGNAVLYPGEEMQNIWGQGEVTAFSITADGETFAL